MNVEASLAHQPDGIRCAAVAAGIKYEGVLDFTVVKLDAPGSAAAVFTKSLCPSYAVLYGREALADGRAQVLAVISKNANVFTPERRRRHDAPWPGGCRRSSGSRAGDIVPSCTGVIGVAPAHGEDQGGHSRACARKLRPGALDEAARAILTTDRGPKVCSVRVGDLVVCAMAKGAGMIEPNMATMLVYFFTNADVDGRALHAILTGAVDRTFNSLTVDSDTSTSDTVAIFSTRAVAARRGEAVRLRRRGPGDVDQARARHRRPVRGRHEAHRVHRAARLVRRRREDHGEEDRQLAAREDRGPRRRPELGPHRHGDRKARRAPGIGAIARDSVVIEMMGQVVFSRAQPIAIDLAALARELKSSTRVSIDVPHRRGPPRRDGLGLRPRAAATSTSTPST